MAIYSNSNGSSIIMKFRDRFLEHHPCPEGVEALENCNGRKDIFTLLASPTASDFLMRSILEGWGPSVSDMESVFKPYLNGRFTAHYINGDRKIGTQIWCNAPIVTIDDDVRWLVLVGCDGMVTINDWQVVRIIVDKNSKIGLKCSDKSIVIVDNYGGVIHKLGGNPKITDKTNGR